MIFQRKQKKMNLKKSNNLKVSLKLKFKKFDVRILLERFWCVVGPQRTGKTSLNRAIFNTLFKKYNKYFLNESRLHVNELNKNGHNLILNVPHLFYSNHECYLDEKKKYKCHDVEFEDLVLPGKNYKGQYFPYRSFIEYQEIDKDADNRDWRNFDLAHKDFFKFFGHNGLTIGCDTQDYSNCDKKMRDLFTDIVFPFCRERTKHFWQIKPRYTWYFFLKNNQLAEGLKEFKEFVKIDVPVVSAYKFTYKGEIHDTYKSLSGEPLYINNLKKYRFRKSIPFSLIPEDIKKFCERYVLRYGKSKKDDDSMNSQ